jgi:hypothetical protein
MKTTEPIAPRACTYVALYPMLLQIAKDHGYTLAAHGSLHRDFDLVAVPWIEEAADALTMIKAMKQALGAVTTHHEMDVHIPDCRPTIKPHGRVGYSLHFTNHGMYGAYVDISVMPRRKVKTSEIIPSKKAIKAIAPQNGHQQDTKKKKTKRTAQPAQEIDAVPQITTNDEGFIHWQGQDLLYPNFLRALGRLIEFGRPGPTEIDRIRQLHPKDIKFIWDRMGEVGQENLQQITKKETI